MQKKNTDNFPTIIELKRRVSLRALVARYTTLEQRGSDWWGLCPLHTESKASFHITVKDGAEVFKCFGCGKGGDIINFLEYKHNLATEQAIEKLREMAGVQKVDNKGGKRADVQKKGFSVAEFAEMKKLPAIFLQIFFRILDLTYPPDDPNGTPAVPFPYFDEAGNCTGVRFRLSADGSKSYWHAYKKPGSLFGLPQLNFFQTKRGWKLDRIVIVEGESDVLTLMYNGIPALGVAGKNAWNAAFAELRVLKEATEILVVQEPGAEDFAREVSDSFPGKVRVVKLPVKDPSELWIAHSNDDFRALWQEAVDAAQPLDAAAPQPALADPERFEQTDSGNAERLVLAHGQDFRWLTDEECFLLWTGELWEHGGKSGVSLLPWTKDVVRAIKDGDWRLKSESAGKRQAMINLSRGERSVPVKSNLFDRHPMLLCVKNGTIDLETQQLRQFQREDYLTKQAGVHYDPAAKCPKFDAFMALIFQDKDEGFLHYIHKALGYSLTGNTGEEAVHLCFGTGANGKTTLFEVMRLILGDYYMPAGFSTFVSNEHDYSGPRAYDLATFKGMRMVTAKEPEKSKPLNEEMIKLFVSSEEMKARQIYERPIRFHPEGKLWLAMNNRPRIRGTDEGIWRRLRHIEFNIRIPDEVKIRDYHKQLFGLEGPGILNRLLQGVKDWMSEGLRPPSSIVDSTATLRELQDSFTPFLQAAFNTGDEKLWAKAGDIQVAYAIWARENEAPSLDPKKLADELQNHRCKRVRANGREQGTGTIYRGLQVNQTWKTRVDEARGPLVGYEI